MKFLIHCQSVLAVSGAALLFYWGAVAIRARLFQESEFRAYRARPYSVRFDSAKHPRDGSVIATLAIPDLKVSSVVVEGVSDRDLSLAPGHIPGTSLPGEEGNVGIAGHRDAVFRPLRWIGANQIISLTTTRGERRYRVVSTEIVDPRDVRVLSQTGRNELTLVTCYPFNYVGHAAKRLIVHADMVPQ